MKNVIINLRVYFIFSWFILSLNTNAQVFDPATVWYTCGRDLQSNIPMTCSQTILPVSYKNNDTIFSSYPNYPQNYVIKQIGNKVYFDNELKYNFDLMVRDTMMIPFFSKDQFFPLVLDSIKTEFILGQNRKAMYLSAIFSETSITKYKQIYGIGTALYSSTNLPTLDRFKLDYYNNSFMGDRLGELSYIKIENQLHKLSDCITCDQLVPTKEESLAEINIQPNPVTDYLHVNTSSPINRYEVYNLSGQILLTDAVHNRDTQYTIDVSTLAKGLYFAKINFSAGGNKVFKFLKE